MTKTMLCAFALVAGLACMTDTDTTPTDEAVVQKVAADHTCGPALTCHHGDHCCTPTPADDVYYCAAATEVCQ